MARTFGPTDIGKILNFLIEQLPENKLAELDAMLEGAEDPYEEAASAPTAAMHTAMTKRRFIGLGAKVRNAIRSGRTNRLGMDSASVKSFGEMFPGADHIGNR